MSNPIITENLNPGSSLWRQPVSSTVQIQSYANCNTVSPGQTINFCVSTQFAGTTYRMDIIRLGWYGGAGATLKASVTGRVGIAQGYWDQSGGTLNNCPSAISDPVTHSLDANWQITDSWTVPGNACTGIYNAIFTDQNNFPQNTGFVVKGNTTADYLYERSFNTDCAYNTWGGFSMYTGTAATKVSLNRPETNAGTNNLFSYEYSFIRWVEMMGYNMSYISDVDFHNNPAQLLGYKAVLYTGHNEYWTKAMRDGAEAAIAGGVSAAFMAANTCYWQIRYEPDAAFNANRTIVCYKVPINLPYTSDPQYGVNNAVVTSLWRDPILNRPENSMIGIMFQDNTHSNNAAWKTDPAMDTTYMAGTGLVANTSYGGDLVGYEWDNIHTGGPSNLKTIATSNITGVSGPSTSNTTTYKAPSGALVFASGSIGFTWALDSFRDFNPYTPFLVIPGMQVFMSNVMGALKGPVFTLATF